MDEPLASVKIVMAGNSLVGKSNLVLRLISNSFDPTSSPTVGFDTTKKVVTVNNILVAVSIWDTAGSEAFRSISRSYYRSAYGVFLLYDVTDRKSFTDLASWLAEMNDQTEPDTTVLIVGNKSDLAQDRVVSETEGRAFAEARGLPFIETSAKDGRAVEEAFNQLLGLILEKTVGKPSLVPQNETGEGGVERIDFTGVPPRNAGWACC
jgi:small GTP-binding protein